MELAFYACPLAHGRQAPGHSAWRPRVGPGDALDRYDFCEADLPVLPLLAASAPWGG